MKIAYFDCSSGISGNMIIGALLNAGLPPSYLKTELKKLLITRYSLLVTNKKTSTYFNIKTKKEKKYRYLKDIIKIIKQSKLSPKIKQKSIQIFKTLAEAESIVHGIPINKVHFHEIGAIDTIIDIIGAVIGLEYLGIEEIYCSPINTGSGTIKVSHGLLPVPAPATLELLSGIPIYDSGIKKELTTPTGAAIIKTLAKGFDPIPRIKVSDIGIGAGSHDLTEQPNILRIIIGEKEIQSEHDAILQIEANIDDLNPKFYDRAIANIMEAGALDAYIMPIRMKKQRNAVQLVVLCKPEDKKKILDSIFTETTTFGIRIFLVEREKLKKQIVKTKYGRVKIGKMDGNI